MPSQRRLQQYAIIISILSVLYNGAEGAVSIVFGAESSSRSLIFFGVQSAIEVISSIVVVWRFRNVAMPGEEREVILSPKDLRYVILACCRGLGLRLLFRREKIASASIGSLLLALAIATEISASVSLASHQTPSTSNSSVIISGSALVVMILIWLPKRYLARALNSSAMQGEATCSLSCIQITIVLLIGSLVFRVWRGGWWLDGATSILLGLLFGWEGWKMVQWVQDPEFNGGCCKTCMPADIAIGHTRPPSPKYQDLCSCCLEKDICRQSDKCKCDSESIDEEASVIFISICDVGTDFFDATTLVCMLSAG
jgi:hypothetical protein